MLGENRAIERSSRNRRFGIRLIRRETQQGMEEQRAKGRNMICTAPFVDTGYLFVRFRNNIRVSSARQTVSPAISSRGCGNYSRYHLRVPDCFDRGRVRRNETKGQKKRPCNARNALMSSPLLAPTSDRKPTKFIATSCSRL